MARLFYVLIGVCIFSCFGCGPLSEPKPKDLIGSYKITAQTRKFLTEKGYKVVPESVYILINSQGEVRLENIPDCVFDAFGKPHGKFTSLNGRWRCCDEIDFWSRFEGLTLWIVLDGKVEAIGLLKLMGAWPPYSLHFIVGDPDNRETIAFEKESVRL